jgi:hypothetical protein
MAHTLSLRPSFETPATLARCGFLRMRAPPIKKAAPWGGPDR